MIVQIIPVFCQLQKCHFRPLLAEVKAYRVSQNKISQRENCNIYIMQEYFLRKIFRIYSAHISSQVCLILLS